MGIGVVIGTEGFRPVGGGFRSSDSPETLCIVAKVGFVDFTGGFRGLFANGDGVRFRMGDGDPLILDAFAGVAEAALLASIPNRPAFYSPFVNPENAERRRNLVLSRMVQEEFITEMTIDDAANLETEPMDKTIGDPKK